MESNNEILASIEDKFVKAIKEFNDYKRSGETYENVREKIGDVEKLCIEAGIPYDWEWITTYTCEEYWYIPYNWEWITTHIDWEHWYIPSKRITAVTIAGKRIEI